MEDCFTDVLNTDSRWNELCYLLDDGYWISFAEEIKVSKTQITELQSISSRISSVSPSKEILSRWKYNSESTTSNLLQVLQKIRHDKALRLINSWMNNQQSPVLTPITPNTIQSFQSLDISAGNNDSNSNKNSEPLGSWLKKRKLEALAPRLQELGADTVEDLEFLDKEVIQELAASLKYVPRKKFLKELGLENFPLVVGDLPPQQAHLPPTSPNNNNIDIQILPSTQTLTQPTLPSPCVEPIQEIIEITDHNIDNMSAENSFVITNTPLFIGQPSQPDPMPPVYQQGLMCFWKDQNTQAQTLLKQAAQLQYPPAFLRLFCLETGEEEKIALKEQAAKHEKWFNEQAMIGDCTSQYNLGLFYETVKEDADLAAFWYQKSADHGLVEAQNKMGHLYEDGYGVPKDLSVAVRWYQKAASQGWATAQCNLGFCYFDGLGVPQDYRIAAYWYEQAANQGSIDGTHNLGLCYEIGFQEYTQAAYWYNKGAELGDPECQFRLGMFYENGQGVQKDMKQALHWLMKASDQNHTLAEKAHLRIITQTTDAPEEYQQGMQRYWKGSDMEAIVWFEKAAAKNYPPAFLLLSDLLFQVTKIHEAKQQARKYKDWFIKEAQTTQKEPQFHLGMYYFLVEEDYVQAVQWLQKSATQDYAPAQCNLAEAYYHGDGVAKDGKEAVYWYMRAARLGYAEALAGLGDCYTGQEGLRIRRDWAHAVRWYKKAAEAGCLIAMNNLAMCYENGEGVKQDYETALYWLKKAAAQGYPQAMHNLGNFYEVGKGVSKDFKQAAFYYRKAAEEDFAKSQNLLGLLYGSGHGVPLDYKQAVYWYQRASDLGYPYAQYNLGVCYEKGQGVKQDLRQAALWFKKASDQHDLKATKSYKKVMKLIRGDKPKQKNVFVKK